MSGSGVSELVGRYLASAQVTAAAQDGRGPNHFARQRQGQRRVLVLAVGHSAGGIS